MTDRPAKPSLASTPAETLAPLGVALGPDYPEIYRTMAECVYIGLLSEIPDVPAEQLIAATRISLEVIRAEIGGTQPYLPKAHYELSGRDRALYERFNGRNLNELAAQSGITPRRMRDIISAGRAEDLARRQGRLDL